MKKTVLFFCVLLAFILPFESIADSVVAKCSINDDPNVLASLQCDGNKYLKIDVMQSVLPSGGATAALQTAGNASLTSLDGKITVCNTGSVTVSSSVLPTGGSTAALQTTGNASLSSIDGKITACNTGNVTVTGALPTGVNSIGQVTANAGTNLNTSALALEAGNLSTINSNIDDIRKSALYTSNVIAHLTATSAVQNASFTAAAFTVSLCRATGTVTEIAGTSGRDRIVVTNNCSNTLCFCLGGDCMVSKTCDSASTTSPKIGVGDWREIQIGSTGAVDNYGELEIICASDQGAATYCVDIMEYSY